MPNRRIAVLAQGRTMHGTGPGPAGPARDIPIQPDAQPQQQEDCGPITCVVSNDGYDVHFTAYGQVSPEDGMPGEGKPPAPFCQDLPATGPTHLTMDLMNREARTQLVAVRVVREEDDDSEEASVPKSPSWMSLRRFIPRGSWRPTWG